MIQKISIFFAISLSFLVLNSTFAAVKLDGNFDGGCGSGKIIRTRFQSQRVLVEIESNPYFPESICIVHFTVDDKAMGASLISAHGKVFKILESKGGMINSFEIQQN